MAVVELLELEATGVNSERGSLTVLDTRKDRKRPEAFESTGTLRNVSHRRFFRIWCDTPVARELDRFVSHTHPSPVRITKTTVDTGVQVIVTSSVGEARDRTAKKKWLIKRRVFDTVDRLFVILAEDGFESHAGVQSAVRLRSRQPTKGSMPVRIVERVFYATPQSRPESWADALRRNEVDQVYVDISGMNDFEVIELIKSLNASVPAIGGKLEPFVIGPIDSPTDRVVSFLEQELVRCTGRTFSDYTKRIATRRAERGRSR